MTLKLSHLRNVVAAAELGSLRAAARLLDVSQPAISRSIREVEQDLGVALFERGPAGSRLTAAGEVFLRRAQLVQAELRRAREEIAQLSGDMTGSVSVGMSAAATFAILPAALRLFRRSWPNAVISVTECVFQGAEPRMARGQLDFYCGPYAPPPAAGQFRSEKLYDQVRLIYCRRGHPLAGPRTLEELEGAHWLKQNLSDKASEIDFHEVFEDMGLPPPHIAMQTSSATTTLAALANSDLLAFLPPSLMSGPIASEVFDVVRIDPPLRAPSIYLVTRTDLPLTPLAEHLYQMMRRAGVYHAARAAATDETA